MYADLLPINFRHRPLMKDDRPIKKGVILYLFILFIYLFIYLFILSGHMKKKPQESFSNIFKELLNAD